MKVQKGDVEACSQQKCEGIQKINLIFCDLRTIKESLLI